MAEQALDGSEGGSLEQARVNGSGQDRPAVFLSLSLSLGPRQEVGLRRWQESHRDRHQESGDHGLEHEYQLRAEGVDATLAPERRSFVLRFQADPLR